MATPPQAAGRLVSVKKGEFLFKENDSSNEFFIVKKGSIRVFRSVDQKEITLDTMGPGMVMGEIAMIANVPRTASCVALEDTCVVMITKQEFDNAFARVPDWFRKIALILVQRLRETDEKISRSFDHDFSIPMAALIVMISYSEKCRQKENSFEINRKFLEYETMDLLAIPLSEVEAGLALLAEKKLLRVEKDCVVITDREGCETLAKQMM